MTVQNIARLAKSPAFASRLLSSTTVCKESIWPRPTTGFSVVNNRAVGNFLKKSPSQ